MNIEGAKTDFEFGVIRAGSQTEGDLRLGPRILFAVYFLNELNSLHGIELWIVNDNNLLAEFVQSLIDFLLCESLIIQNLRSDVTNSKFVSVFEFQVMAH